MRCTRRVYAPCARCSLQTAGAAYGAAFNLLVVPCVSPWGYETIQRWNAQVVWPEPLVQNATPDPISNPHPHPLTLSPSHPLTLTLTLTLSP